MATYVGPVAFTEHRPGGGKHTVCHLMADTREELDLMAVNLGIDKANRVNSSEVSEHYRLTGDLRLVAVRLGAMKLTAGELLDIIDGKKRAQGQPVRHVIDRHVEVMSG